MNDLSKLLQSPFGQLGLELAGMALGAILGPFFSPVLRKYWDKKNTPRIISIVLSVFFTIAIVFWFLYPQSSLPRAATLGLVILVLSTWYNYSQQIGEAYSVKIPRRTKPIRVRKLRMKGLAPDEPLYLKWDTIGKGAEYLFEQIKQHSPAIYPDLIIGVNELGTIVASFLAGKLQCGNRRIGIVCTGNPIVNGRTKIYSFPETILQEKELVILVIDGEYKSGKNITEIKDDLLTKFPTSKVFIAALVACEVNEAVKDLAPKAYQKDDESNDKPVAKPHFLAFFTSGDMEPPGLIS